MLQFGVFFTLGFFTTTTASNKLAWQLDVYYTNTRLEWNWACIKKPQRNIQISRRNGTENRKTRQMFLDKLVRYNQNP